jgi:hypothetical protein
MKLFVVGLLAALLQARPAASQEPAHPDRAADRGQINHIVTRREQAWNTHDMKAFGTIIGTVRQDGLIWTARGRPYPR